MRSRTADRLCAEAVDLARTAAEETAGAWAVGDHLGVVAEGDRVVTHSFACEDPAYRGWRWAVTVARASRAKLVTVDEAVLLPDADAILAPEWVPWSERLRPGDMGPGDLLPTEADDLRLEPGWMSVPDDEVAVPEPDLPAAAATESVVAPDDSVLPAPDAVTAAALAEQLGLRRARVLSRYGLHTAADRWEESFGTKSPMAQAAPAHCVSCGFLAPISGSLRQAFGICANEFSPADGRVVSLAYGCGGHSEAAVMPTPPQPAAPVLDELGADPLR
ncbi:DUF3027 domain-containing protein [Streptantibioticus silvisoli]|uniref:DUF3027 domain-containing protein n=1 Tax=Streptantibioticus silvisoli TaxID=2705255 RepID=A0ABT6W371_9ACTN|nr:DUF3027 domain-containing protein [Streptantibioticus silvisoli]MDI5965186.1 DUF3027 domain-containing protein [Streptantibioticus silvisoli]